MKKTFSIALVLFISVLGRAQIKDLQPHSVNPLNLSEQGAKLYDGAFEKLFDGVKLEDLTDAERNAIEHGDETKGYWETIGSGCSWYCGGGPMGVSASSSLAAQGSNDYSATNAHDLNYKNAWVEGVAGYGVGEHLEYTFEGVSPRITEIIVVNGYIKSAAAYKNNSRVKKLKVYIDDKPYAILNLRDIRSAQHFKVGPLGTSDRDDWEVMKALPNWTLKFEILEVYRGDKYDDTVISEIYFDGLDVHCFAAGTQILMADGSEKNIEDLKVDDEVVYWNHKTGETNKAIIRNLASARHEKLVKYLFESGKSITATQDHPFRIKDKGWASMQPEKSKQYKGFKHIEKIAIGDVFQTTKGFDKLIAIAFPKGEQMTYTITQLSEGDNFIANGLIVGVEEIDID